jgi:Tfp pilus assembly protein PilX
MMTISHSETDKKVSAIANERGAALIIVLIMLVLLAILGASMLATSTSDLKIAGNYRNSEEAFYTADSAMEIAQTFSEIYTNIDPKAGSTWPSTGDGVQYDCDLIEGSANVDNGKNTDYANYNRIEFTNAKGGSTEADVKVEFMGSGNPPAGYGVQEDSSISPGSSSYKANYFAISVIAYGKKDTVSKLESQLARIVQQ